MEYSAERDGRQSKNCNPRRQRLHRQPPCPAFFDQGSRGCHPQPGRRKKRRQLAHRLVGRCQPRHVGRGTRRRRRGDQPRRPHRELPLRKKESPADLRLTRVFHAGDRRGHRPNQATARRVVQCQLRDRIPARA